MRRLVRSRAAFVLLVVSVIVAALVGVRALQERIVEQTEEEAVTTARLVADLSMTVTISGDADHPKPLLPEENADLDVHLTALARRGRVEGLELWGRDGSLLYADPGHLGQETRLPDAELRRSLRGQAWVKPAGQSRRGGPTFEVFIPYDRNGDGGLDAIVEVLIPQGRITGQVRRSTRLLETSAAVMLGVLLLAFGSARRVILSRERRSLRDPLTGLLNRDGLLQELEHSRGSRRQASRTAAVLMLDLDQFKAVNDTLGHSAGDGLLVQVARLLRESVRPGDPVARLSADEFAVLLPDIPDVATAEAAGRNLLDRLRNGTFVVDGVELSVDAAIGVSCLEEGLLGELVLQRADAALYRAKKTNAGVATYDAAADRRDLGQLALLVELRQGIENDELELYYQPKARLKTGDIAGVEALVRWNHPERGFTPPDVFIPPAEGTRLIEPLTRWVLRQAIRQTGQWRDDGLMLPVAVNVSPRVLLEGDFPGTVLDLLAEASVPAELLELEITETAVLTDPEQAFAVCRRLAAMGIRIAVDDFGAGYTSLSYLKRLPADTLKLDRLFVKDAVADAEDRAVVESVVQLGHRLGMTVVAEGIEDEATWRLLGDLGYDEGQGFLLARPMPAAELLRWIHTRRRPDRLGTTDPQAREAREAQQ